MIRLSSEDKPDYSETFRQFFVHLEPRTTIEKCQCFISQRNHSAVGCNQTCFLASSGTQDIRVAWLCRKENCHSKCSN